MTKLLEKAVSAATKLSEGEQDELAAMILEELADEERWAKSFASSGNQLSKLAREALAECDSSRKER